MEMRFLPSRSARLIVGASFLALVVAACNKQPTATEAPMVAPPMAALHLAAGTPPAQSPAPAGAALAAPSTPIRYAPLPASEGYGYIDQAYSMGQAFADTPPDYAVDYQGTRPWIWRAGDGAYRIVERLPQGERFFYYRSGQDYPFLVRDPDYSYAYDNGDLVAVYGADGAELSGEFAASRADEAARYLYRARELYRAAQYQQRESAYANEWGGRQDQLQRENLIWQQQQAQNARWHAWHEAHQAQEQQQWISERNRRVAYAAAIGLTAASRSLVPDPVQLSRRQAAYFSNWDASHGHAPTSQQAAATNTISPPQTRIAPSVAAAKGGSAANLQIAQVQRNEVTAAQPKVAEAAQVQEQAAEAKQRNFTAAAQARSAQAARDRQLAAQAQLRETAAARIKAAQAARAEKLAAQAKQHEAAATQAKVAAQAAQPQKAAASAKRSEAAAAQASAAQAVKDQKVAAEAKLREAAAAKAQAAQAAGAEKSAAEAKQRETAAAQAQAARAARAEKSAAEAKQREATAAQAKAAQEAHAKQQTPQARHENPSSPPAGKRPDHSKRKAPKDQQGDRPQ